MYKTKKVFQISPNPIIEIKRVDTDIEIDPEKAEQKSTWKRIINSAIKDIAYLSQEVNPNLKNNVYQSNKLLSISYSRNIHSLEGTFQIQLKEDYSTGKSILDLLQPLDVVYIRSSNTSNYDFCGVISTISFGATAGAYNKVVSISGESVSSLLQKLVFSTDATALAFFQVSGGNASFGTIITNLLDQNNCIGYKISDAFNKIYSSFVNYMIDAKNKQISNRGLYNIILATMGINTMFISSSVTFKFPIEANFFNQNEVNIYDYFKQFLPEQVYDFYSVRDLTASDKNFEKIIIREKPFQIDEWQKLNLFEIDPALIVDYTFTRTNSQVYTNFYASISGSSMSPEQYLMESTNIYGRDDLVNGDEEKCKLYGYKPLVVKFNGYARNVNKNETTTIVNMFKDLSKKLKDWYANLDDYYSGDITFVDIGEGNCYLGNKIKLCGAEFYVTEQHYNWQYGDAPTINLQLERGGKYTDSGFSKIKGISNQFAELLTKE